MPTRKATCRSRYARVRTRRPHARLVKCIVPDQVNEAAWHIRRRAERRSSRKGTALAWSCSCSAGNKQGTNRQSVCAEIIGAEALMSLLSLLALLRGISDVVAHSTVRPGEAGYPTARRQ